jgi:hypothetical protein
MTVGLTEVAMVRRQVNLAHAIGATRARVLWRIRGPCRRDLPRPPRLETGGVGLATWPDMPGFVLRMHSETGGC